VDFLLNWSNFNYGRSTQQSTTNNSPNTFPTQSQYATWTYPTANEDHDRHKDQEDEYHKPSLKVVTTII